jgi:hypothetical protein
MKFMGSISKTFEGIEAVRFRSTDPRITNFIQSCDASEKFCCLRVQKEETFYHASNIYWLMTSERSDTYLMLEADSKFKDGVDLFCKENLLKLLVVQVKSGQETIIDMFKNQLQKTDSSKKIIIISENQVLLNEVDTVHVNCDPIKLSDIHEDHLKKLLTKQISFQEKAVQYSEIFDVNDGNLLGSLSLMDLLETNTIGWSVICSQNFNPTYYGKWKILKTVPISS